MKVLITGGAGYIGSVITNRFLQDGHKVRVADALWYDRKVPLIHFSNPDYEFRRCDISGSSCLDECLDGVDFVVHTAAVVGEPASKKYPELTRKINYDASIGLIDKASRCGIKGLIFLSTCSNYGVAEGLADEGTALQPLSLYAETKINVERYLMSSVKELDWVICRLSTAYGISPRMRFDLTVSDFTLTAFNNRCLEIYLPHSYRPYIHVFDIARVLSGMIKDFGKIKNNVFNVGFEGENYRKIEIADMVKKFIPDTDIRIVKEGPDARDYKVDFSKLKKYLGLSKTYGVEDGVKELVESFNLGIMDDCHNRKYYNTCPDLGQKTDPAVVIEGRAV